MPDRFDAIATGIVLYQRSGIDIRADIADALRAEKCTATVDAFRMVLALMDRNADRVSLRSAIEEMIDVLEKGETSCTP